MNALKWSRRLLSLLFFLAVLSAQSAPFLWAQVRPNARALPESLRQPTRPGFGALGTLGRSAYISERSLPADITRRSTEGLAGFGRRTRATVGGENGANVPEQVINLTRRAAPLRDEITPFWTQDAGETFIFYASTTNNGAGAQRYQLYRINANAATDPTSPAPASPLPTEVRLTGGSAAINDSDFLFPTLDVNRTRIAFIRSTDGRALTDPLKRWNLFVTAAPSGAAAPGVLDLNPAGTNLLSLTQGRAFGGRAFVDVQRPSWVGTSDVIFSGLLEGDTAYHLFKVNTATNFFTRLTDGPAGELNPTVLVLNNPGTGTSTNYIAFDSNAAGYTTTTGTPATASGVVGERNIFVLAGETGGVTQITNAAGISSVEPAWSSLTSNNRFNQAGQNIYIAFASNRGGLSGATYAPASTTDIFYIEALRTSVSTTPRQETAPTGATPARRLDTADPNFQYNEHYPAWPALINFLRLVHQSDRTGSLRSDVTGLPFTTNFTPTPGQNDLFLSSIIDINAPILLRYDLSRADGEVVHVNLGMAFDPAVAADPVRTPRQGLLPNTDVFFTVRVDDRESGMQPEKTDGGTGAVFVIIKNPNSKYQAGSGGLERKEFSGTAYTYFNTNLIPYNFNNGGGIINYGFEYECQAISAADRSTYFFHNNTVGTTLLAPGGGPLYTASIDDRLAFSGGAHPPQDGTGNTPQIWLALQRLPQSQQDNRGGILYGATWRTPAVSSDWYIDVVAYDQAINPVTPTERINWIIYDNVWGFSTQTFSGANGLLVVMDYPLGQKFFRSRFSQLGTGVPTSNNLLPLFWGAESYFTDVGRERLPLNDMAFNQAVPFGVGRGVTQGTPNTLGVQSYTDTLNDDRVRVDGLPLPPTGRYDIWRILSRGPIRFAGDLQGYLPSRVETPADLRVGETNPRSVLDAQRMVIWASPFSTDLFTGPGTILDQNTQNDLTAFVNAGGRLFLSGQNVAFGLTFGNTRNNPFFTNVLKATLLNNNGGSTSLVSSAGGSDNSIAADPWTRDSHEYWQDTGSSFTKSPLSGGNIPITNTLPINNSAARADASMTSAFGGGALDVIGVTGNAYAQFNYTSGNSGIITNTDATTGGRVAFCSLGFESVGYEWYNVSRGNPAVALTSNFGRRAEIMHNITCGFRTGTLVGRVTLVGNASAGVPGVIVRASSRAEDQAAEYTGITDQNGDYQIPGIDPDQYTVYAYKRGFATIQQTAGNTVHGGTRSAVNLVTTPAPPGVVAGRVFRSDKTTPLQGVEVQLRAANADGTIDVLRGTSGTDGSYNIPGVPVGFYTVIANPPGIIDINNDNLVNQADLDDPNHPENRVDVNGNGTVDLADIADPRNNVNYKRVFESVVVTQAPQPDKFLLGTGVTVDAANQVQVKSGETTAIDFYLAAPPQPITGRVVDQNGTPLAGASVTATITGGTVVAGPVTTNEQGVYLLPALEGSITITATRNGYSTNSVTVAAGGVGTLTAPDIVLTKLPPGSISGLVTAFGTNAPVEGATVQLLLGGTVVATTTTTAVQTASDGYTFNYRFDNVEVGQYTVRASAAGFYGSNPTEATATVATGVETRGVNFVLLTPGSLSGLVTLATGNAGAPVAGAALRIYRADDLSFVNGVVTFTPATTTGDGYTFNYRIDVVPPGNYVAQVTKEGLTSDPVQIAFTISPGVETRNVNFRLLPLKVYGPGLQLISTPFDYSDLPTRSVFGLTPDQPAYAVFNVAQWLPQQDDYLIGPDVRLVAGKGYFVRFGDVTSVQVRGRAVAAGTPFDLALPAGWNLIGNPFDPATDAPNDGSLDISQITVIGPDGTTYSLAGAAAAGLVRDVVFSYTGSSGGSQYVQGSLLRPWIGYWFRAFAPVTLRLPPPASTRSAATGAAARGTITRADVEKTRFRAISSKGANDWRLQIAARQSDLLDTDNSIGVAPGARDGWDTRFDTPKPPMIREAPSLYLAFQGRDPQGRATALTDDIRSPESGETRTWEFTVQAGGEGEVTLSVPNVNRLPRKLVPILVDVETGQRVNLRSSPAYRYTPGGRAAHRFRIEVRPPISRPLTVTDVKVLRSGPSSRSVMSGYRFSFRTTQEANVQVEVQTLTGKSVRQLRTRALAVEETAVVWDGRGDKGEALPGGAYVLKLTARDDAGNVVRVQRPIISTR